MYMRALDCGVRGALVLKVYLKTYYLQRRTPVSQMHYIGKAESVARPGTLTYFNGNCDQSLYSTPA